MRFRAWVQMPDGAVRHARYDSVTDQTSRFLCTTAEEAFELGWAMESDYDPTWDGQGVPVLAATDYDDTVWPGIAYCEPGAVDWWWLSSGHALTSEDVIQQVLPEWAVR